MKRGPGEPEEGPNKRSRSDRFEVRLLIPSKVAGSIIGKGGANIQKLRTDNNATVRIPGTIPKKLFTPVIYKSL